MYCIVLLFIYIFAIQNSKPIADVWQYLPKQQTMNLENTQAQMRKGILEYCILLIISRQVAYVSDIIHKLKDSRIIVVEGTIYPMLTRLKNAGLLAYRWEESPQGPPRKYYSITDKGRSCLSELENSWNEMTQAIQQLRNQSF